MDTNVSHFTILSIESVSQSSQKRKIATCKCICGNIFISRLYDLNSGKKRSCGCKTIIVSTKTHGLTHTKEWNAWRMLRQRCNKPESKFYINYGGRGIKVCDRWMKSFENFYKDMGLAPSKTHSIDRINVNGNYEPDNCRWATPKQQANNKRMNLVIEFNGEKKTLQQWSEYYNIGPRTIKYRLSSNWSVKDSLTKKPKKTGCYPGSV